MLQSELNLNPNIFHMMYKYIGVWHYTSNALKRQRKNVTSHICILSQSHKFLHKKTLKDGAAWKEKNSIVKKENL